MTLDYGCRIAGDRNALDHVRVKRSLREKFVTAVLARLVLSIFDQKFFGRMLKHSNEFVPDNFSFLFRIGHAFERGQEPLGRVDIFQADVKIFAKDALNDFLLTRAEQAVVHKNAGELIADRFVEQRGGDGRIDAAT